MFPPLTRRANIKQHSRTPAHRVLPFPPTIDLNAEENNSSETWYDGKCQPKHPRLDFKARASWIKADGGQAFSTGFTSEICLHQQHLHVISEHTASPERSRSSVELGGWGGAAGPLPAGVYLQEVKRSDLSQLIWHLFKGTNTAEECACVKVPWFWGGGGGSGGSQTRRHALGAAPTHVLIRFPAVDPQTPLTAKVSLCSVLVGEVTRALVTRALVTVALVPAHETAQKQNQHGALAKC